MMEFMKGISRKSHPSVEGKGGMNMRRTKGVLAIAF
jgi:hypothetical protein